jgi:signal peptidase
METRVQRAAWALLGASLLALALAALGVLTGHRMLVVRSGSMSPAIATGDAIVVEGVPATALAVGEVVTFPDPTRHGLLVTHRVRAVASEPGHLLFTTRGDANNAAERWSTPDGGRLGRMVLRLPNAGYAIAGLAAPLSRLCLVVAAALLLAYATLRDIWAPA